MRARKAAAKRAPKPAAKRAPKPAAKRAAKFAAKSAAGAVQDVRLYDGLFVRWMGKLAADLPMIFEIAKQAKGPIVELGVGAGRVAVPLARRGHRVTGVDNARAMLDAARATLAKEKAAVARRVTLLEQDLRTLDVPAVHRLALLPFNTLCHFESLADQDKVIAGARRALLPGGWLWLSVFAFDASRPAGVLRAEPAPLPGEPPGRPGARTEAFFQQTMDSVAQVTEARFWLDTVAPDGVVRRESITLRMRWFHRFELERLLAAHGFTVVRWFGDFDGSDVGDGTPQLIALARRD